MVAASVLYLALTLLIFCRMRHKSSTQFCLLQYPGLEPRKNLEFMLSTVLRFVYALAEKLV